MGEDGPSKTTSKSTLSKKSRPRSSTVVNGYLDKQDCRHLPHNTKAILTAPPQSSLPKLSETIYTKETILELCHHWKYYKSFLLSHKPVGTTVGPLSKDTSLIRAPFPSPKNSSCMKFNPWNKDISLIWTIFFYPIGVWIRGVSTASLTWQSLTHLFSRKSSRSWHIFLPSFSLLIRVS